MSRSLYWKVLAGCFLAASCLLTIAASVILSLVPPARAQMVPGLLALVGLGGVLLVIGVVKAKGSRLENAGTPSDEIFSRLDFWGGILLLASLSTFLLNRNHLPVKAAPLPQVVSIAAPVVLAPVVFPELELKGAVCNGAKSTAVINGQVLQVGESIEGVKVIAIDQSTVTIELAGVTKELRLR